MAPEPVPRELGIKPPIEQVFRFTDGSKIIRKEGGAFVKYGNAIGAADVIFGEEDDTTLLGHLGWKPWAWRGLCRSTSDESANRIRQGQLWSPNVPRPQVARDGDSAHCQNIGHLLYRVNASDYPSQSKSSGGLCPVQT